MFRANQAWNMIITSNQHNPGHPGHHATCATCAPIFSLRMCDSLAIGASGKSSFMSPSDKSMTSSAFSQGQGPQQQNFVLFNTL
jgi:hypothetical protein